MISNGEMQFNAETHEYSLNGEKYISVTQLLKKHGLTTDYSAVNAETLRKAAERGNFIHSEIEKYVTTGAIGFSSECEDFANICEQNGIKPTKAEFVVYDTKYKVAGTVDLKGDIMNGSETAGYFVGDNKTTTTLNKEALAWQLSIYAYLMGADTTAFKLLGFHLLTDNKSKLVEVSATPMEEITKLLEAEKNGERYQKNELVIADNEIAELAKAQELLELYDSQKKIAEQNIEEIKNKVLSLMESQNIKTFENDTIRITYTAPSKRTTIDSTKLKKDLPDIAKQYEKIAEVKARLTVTLRCKNGTAT